MQKNTVSLVSQPSARNHYMDWVRIFVVVTLIPVHCAMVFVDYFWMIKNQEKSQFLWNFAVFMSEWRMPLLFLISGYGTWFALKKRKPGEYLKERALRLLVPLVFGSLVLVPPQVYLEKVTKISPRPYVSFFDFLPSAWSGIYPNGNLSWHHLWFVIYLFVFSAISLPIFVWSRKSKEVVDSWFTHAKGWKLMWFLPLPLVLFEVALRPIWPSMPNLTNDWASFLFYLYLFILGFHMSINSRIIDLFRENVFLLLGCAVALTVLQFSLPWQHYPESKFSLEFCTYVGLRAVGCWLWIGAAIGLAKLFLNFENRFLSYATEGIYPFYILHQTIIVFFAYYIRDLSWSVAPKYTALCVVSFCATVVCYHFLVRPFGLMRFLFGMKPRGLQKELSPKTESPHDGSSLLDSRRGLGKS